MPVNEAAIATPGPLCQLEGFTIPGIAGAHSPQSSTGIISGSTSPSTIKTSDLLFVIAEQDKTKYARMFMNAGPQDGLLDGEKARDIFIKSNLPFEKLGQIWSV